MSEPKHFKNLSASLELHKQLKEAPDDFQLNRREAALFLRKSVRTIDYYVARARNRKRVNKTLRGKAAYGPLKLPSAQVKIGFVKIGGEVFFTLGELRKMREEGKLVA